MKSKTISILGCGWLGLPLAKRLQADGHRVKGSTTTINKLNLLEESNIEPHLLILNPDVRTEKIEEFLDSKILVINIPPKQNENVLELFPAQIKYLIKEVENSEIGKVLFVSSTSVYGNSNTIVTEESELNPESKSGKALIIAEGLLRANIFFNTTILRFGGLIGLERHPGSFLGSGKNINGAESKVNLIHLNDCIEIISKVISKNIWGEIFNAAADEHPTKKELYTKAAENLNVEPPEFSEDSTSYKIVSSEKLKSALDFNFKFPNPLKMF